MPTKKKYVQVYNSRIGKWVKIDRETSTEVSVKKSKGPYANTPKYRKKKS